MSTTTVFAATTARELKAAIRPADVKRTEDGAFMLATLLEKTALAPVKGYHKPFFNPTLGPQLKEIMRAAHVPVLNWSRSLPADGTPMTDIDANAAYVAAASSAPFAHGDLFNYGPVSPEDAVRPGYYLVDVYPWQLDAPGSPLGAQETGRQAWVTHITYKLLRDLTYGSSWCDDGYWPDVTVYDSWVSKVSMRLSDWTDVIRDFRTIFLDAGDEDAYEGLKLGYSQAIQMWMVPPDPKGTAPAERKKKNKAYRPDWVHTVHSQHTMNMWRRAFIASEMGHAPIQVGGTDHLTDGMAWKSSDLTAVLAHPKAPLRLDSSKKGLGTFKVTRRYFAGQDEVDLT